MDARAGVFQNRGNGMIAGIAAILCLMADCSNLKNIKGFL
jgi:hypothetical protein